MPQDVPLTEALDRWAVESKPAVALHLDIDDRLDVVTVGIDEKRRIVVRPIVRPQARLLWKFMRPHA